MTMEDTRNNVSFGSEDIYNTSYFQLLSEWQKSQLNKMSSPSGIQCLLKMWLNYSYDENSPEGFCNATWDSVYCWPPTKSGTVISRECTIIIQEAHPHKQIEEIEGKAIRECSVNETWGLNSKIDYNECSKSYDLYLARTEENRLIVRIVQFMLFYGSIISLVGLLIALAVFYHYRCLWCHRVTVHIHLMLSLLLRFIFMLIIAEPFVFGRKNSFQNVDILCETILVIFLYATFASMSWMFVQGLFLNVTLMSSTAHVNTRYHLAIYCVIGWVVPAVFVVIYVIAMISKKQKACWQGYANMKEIWILLGPITLEVIVNGIFLINVLRILLRKIRNSHTRPDSSQIKAAAKATAILFPVLGINNLVLLYNPGGEYQKYFVLLNTFFGATQVTCILSIFGILVAIVYCFIDNDVCKAIRRSLDRARTIRNVNQSANEHQRREASSRQIPMGVISNHHENNDSVEANMEESV